MNLRINNYLVGQRLTDSGICSVSDADVDVEGPAVEMDRLDDRSDFLAGRRRVPFGGVGRTNFRDSGLSSRPTAELWLYIFN